MIGVKDVEIAATEIDIELQEALDEAIKANDHKALYDLTPQLLNINQAAMVLLTSRLRPLKYFSVKDFFAAVSSHKIR